MDLSLDIYTGLVDFWRQLNSVQSLPLFKQSLNETLPIKLVQIERYRIDIEQLRLSPAEIAHYDQICADQERLQLLERKRQDLFTAMNDLIKENVLLSEVTGLELLEEQSRAAKAILECLPDHSLAQHRKLAADDRWCEIASKLNSEVDRLCKTMTGISSSAELRSTLTDYAVIREQARYPLWKTIREEINLLENIYVQADKVGNLLEQLRLMTNKADLPQVISSQQAATELLNWIPNHGPAKEVLKKAEHYLTQVRAEAFAGLTKFLNYCWVYDQRDDLVKGIINLVRRLPQMDPTAEAYIATLITANRKV